MTSQIVKYLDIKQSYIPSEPNVFPINLIDYSKEETQENPRKIVAYDGHNFIPTSEGYKSYFGTQHQLDIEALQTKADYVLVFQTATYVNVLVALCEDGVYIKQGETSGVWVHAIDHVIPEEYLPWHWTTLSNDLYIYRNSYPDIWKVYFNPADVIQARPELLPSDLAMTVVDPVGSSGITSADYMAAFAMPGGLFTSFTSWLTVPALTSGVLAWDTPVGIEAAAPCRVYKKTSAGAIYYLDLSYRYPSTPNWRLPLAESLTGWTLLVDGLPDLTRLEESVYYMPKSIPISFLNTEAQQGMFSAGIRLGFWDSENSVAWSSIDNVGDFTPSLTTLAGSTIFADVVGKIVTIKRMRDGFIIYATQSIVFVAKDLSSSMGWQPRKLADFGISYPKQVAASSTIDQHFAYTSAGIYKVEAIGLEAIVPDFYELTKKTELPWHLELLCHRYLMFSSLDSDLDNRLVRTRVDTIPGIQWKISPGITWTTDMQQFGDILDNPMDAFCATAEGVLPVHATKSGQNQGEDLYNPLWRPFYDTKYSTAGIPPSIDWQTGGACPTLSITGEALAFNPANVLLGNNAHHIEFSDDPDGPSIYWQNIDKFVATQTALWEVMDKKRAELLAEISDKNHTSEIFLRNDVYEQPGYPSESLPGTFESARYGVGQWDPANSLSPAPTSTPSLCEIGYLPLIYSDPYLQVTDCGVFYTRVCIARIKLLRYTVDATTANQVIKTGPVGWHATHFSEFPVSEPLTSPNTLVHQVYPTLDALDEVYMNYPGTDAFGKTLIPRSLQALDTPQGFWRMGYRESTGQTLGVYQAHFFQGGRVERKQSRRHILILGQVEYGAFGLDRGSMVIAGWKQQFGEGAVLPYTEGECVAPVPPEGPYKSPSATYSFPGDHKTGSICGQSYIPIQLPPSYGGATLNWPAQIINIPGVSWLMQRGVASPAYPVLTGSYMYDLSLKKWGRHKDNFQLYVDYYPVNTSMNQSVPYETLQVKAGILNLAGKLCIFDDSPTTSEICYGKIGYYRTGYTDLEEVRVHFASPSTGYVIAEPSYDAQYPEASNVVSESFMSADQVTLLANLSARWYNVTVTGKYDISYLEFRGTRAGRR